MCSCLDRTLILNKRSFSVYIFGRSLLLNHSPSEWFSLYKKAASPKLTAKQTELAQVESEIEKLLDTLTGATPVLISYANAKIEELDSRRQALASEIAKLTAEAVSPEQIDTISNYLDDWENVSFEDKQQVVDLMITVIRATSEKLQIEWKI